MKRRKELLSGYDLARKIYDASRDDISGMVSLAGDENCWLEFKASIYSRPSDKSENENDDDSFWHVARSVIAFMNSSGGVVVIGIQDGTANPVPLSENDPRDIMRNHGIEAYLRQEILEHLPGRKTKWSTGLTGTWTIDEKIPEGTVYIEKSVYKNCDIALVFVRPLARCITVKRNSREYMLVRRAGAEGGVKELTAFQEMNQWVQARQIEQPAFNSCWERYEELSQNGFHYFAFISYSHKDEKWAKWLQERLESYRLPSTIAKNIGRDKPRNLRPVFRDSSDLPVGNLVKNLRHEMYYSQFLIVICSPASAHPSPTGQHYVNGEIEFFRQIGKEDKIIPVIVDGTPGGGADECFPPALASLGILGLDVRKQSRKRTVNDIVARMLNLRPDVLWKRWRRKCIYDIVMRCIASIVVLFCFAVCCRFVFVEKEDMGKHAEAKRMIRTVFPNPPARIIYVDTDERGGSGVRPSWHALVCVEEQKDKYYYLLYCPMGCPEELDKMYLGKNIEILKCECENGFLMAEYKDNWNKTVYTGIPVGGICGSYPGNDGLYPELSDNSDKAETAQNKESEKYGIGGFDVGHEKFIDNFLHDFQKHLRNNDKKALSEMFDFPLRVFLAGRREIMVDKDGFIKHFDLIFYPEFKSAVLALKDEDPWCSWRGVCIGGGCIWFKAYEEGISVTLDNSLEMAESLEENNRRDSAATPRGAGSVRDSSVPVAVTDHEISIEEFARRHHTTADILRRLNPGLPSDGDSFKRDDIVFVPGSGK